MPHQPRRDGPAHTGGPSLTGRALLALAFLLGFYVLEAIHEQLATEAHSTFGATG